MNIMLQDALIIYSILFFFGFISILSIARGYQPNFNNSYYYFLGFFLLNSFGVFGIYFRESLPLFISVIITNYLLYLGYVALLIGIGKFYKEKPLYKTAGLLSILFVTLFIIFTYVEPNFKIRILVFVGFVMYTALHTLYIHCKNVNSFNITRSIFSTMLTLLILVNFIRALMLLVPTTAGSFLDYSFDSLNVILTAIAGSMIAFGILAIINNQILKDLKEFGNIFENSIKNAPTPIMIHDEYGNVINISRNWTSRSHYTKEDIPTIFDWTKKAYGQNKQVVRDFIRKIYDFPNERHDSEFIVTTKDGRKINWDFNSGYIGKLPDGRRVAMSVAMDVTERQEKEREISYLSYHDQLTGLYNRRFFEEQLVRLDNPRNLPLSIVMGDVNGLKLINDAFGHSAGDVLLQTIGTVISNNIRGNDVAARWGGDEFAILLPGSNSKGAEILINRIQQQIDKANFEYGAVSISFGIDTKYEVVQNVQKVFNAAEEIMYQNKLNEIDSIRGETINTIMNTLFEKSIAVREHSERVSQISAAIADSMGLSKTRVNDIKSMGMIHDIGKIVIDLHILDKPEKLNDIEKGIMEKHPLSGSKMLASSHEYTRLAAGVLHHHERIDGKGYPNGLKGDQIPIESKIIGVADAFDAMTAERPYRNKTLSLDEAVAELKKHSGTQFDAKVVKVFVEKVLKK